MIVVHFNMQGEDIFEHTNGKCHVLAFKYARRRFSWTKFGQLSQVSLVYNFNQLLDHCVTHAY